MKGLKRLFNELLRTTGIYPPRDTAARFLQAIKNNDVAAIQHTLKQHPTATRRPISEFLPASRTMRWARLMPCSCTTRN